MGAQAERILAKIREQGTPDPWNRFGEGLSLEAAHAVQLRIMIEATRKTTSEPADPAIDELFARKGANLARTTRLLADIIADYDQRGMWAVLDERAARLDIDDVSEPFLRAVGLHPFPVVVRSLVFNWTHIKQHGARAFYAMTADYLDRLKANHQRWAAAWTAEATTGVVDRLTTIECDLVSEEAPMHCHVCENTIAALLYLD